MRSWRCAMCDSYNIDVVECHRCGGRERMAIYPAKTPNELQNTPSIDDLVTALNFEESQRETTVPVAQQISELVQQFFTERNCHEHIDHEDT